MDGYDLMMVEKTGLLCPRLMSIEKKTVIFAKFASLFQKGGILLGENNRKSTISANLFVNLLTHCKKKKRIIGICDG